MSSRSKRKRDAKTDDDSANGSNDKTGVNNKEETVYQFDRDAEYAFVFAHGAGVGKDSEWMKAWSSRMAKIGPVHALNYPYMQGDKRRPPNRLPKLIAYHMKYLADTASLYRRAKIVLIGKSMGSRVSCHVTDELGKLQRPQNQSNVEPPEQKSPDTSHEPKKKKRKTSTSSKKSKQSNRGAVESKDDQSKLDEDLKALGMENGLGEIDAERLLSRVTAVVCLGYPYQTSSGKIRDEVLSCMPKRVLFVQGSRDKMSPNDKLRKTMKQMSEYANSSLFIVDTGDHSLQVLKKATKSQNEVDEDIFERIKAFVQLS